MSGSTTSTPAQDRRRRLAEALRVNLRRRKARNRAVAAGEPDLDRDPASRGDPASRCDDADARPDPAS